MLCVRMRAQVVYCVVEHGETTRGEVQCNSESKEQAQEYNNKRKRTMERATWLSGLGQVRQAGAGSRTYVCA